MANGKGTIACHYCKHYAAQLAPRCELYGVPLPMDDIGIDNPICSAFTESNESSALFNMPAQLADLMPRMKRGFLYAFPYPSHTRSADLREVARLSPHA